MNRNPGYIAIGVAAIFLLVTAPVHADPIYDTSAMGELSANPLRTVSTTGGLVFGGGNSALDFASLDWTITPITNGFHYLYEFFYESQQGISHFVLDLSDDCTATNGCVVSAVSNGRITMEYGTYTEHNGNPGFPGEIAGIKFNTQNVGGNTTFILEFDSPRVPVYGDFYAKGGNGGAGQNPNGFAVYNAGADDHLSENYIDFIARPDGASAVPEPGSLLLLGTGLAALSLVARRRGK